MDFLLNEFANKKYEQSVALIGLVSKIKDKEYSPKFKQILALTFTIEKYLGINPQKNLPKKITAYIVSDINMIAPFQVPWIDCFDCRLNINLKEKMLVYIGKHDKNWEIVHISKIRNELIYFPEFKKQKSFTISVNAGELVIQNEFKKYFSK